MIRNAIEVPFSRNHCVPVAWAHVAGLDTEGCSKLAASARAAGHLTRAGVAYDARGPESLGVYARLAGVTISKVVRYLRTGIGWTAGGYYTPVRHYVTLTTFARTHARGRYVVFVNGHAVACIRGVIYGFYKPRSRVAAFVKVEVA